MKNNKLPEKIRLKRNSALTSYRSLALSIFSWLFLLNTGGILALSNLIHKKAVDCIIASVSIKTMLVTFGLGIFFAFIAMAVDYGIQAFRYKVLEDNCNKFWANKKSNVEELMNYSKISLAFLAPLIFEFLSALCFFIGLITGVISLLST